jgi:hypothetical protein
MRMSVRSMRAGDVVGRTVTRLNGQRPWCRDANRGLHRDPVVVPVLPRTLPETLVNS